MIRTLGIGWIVTFLFFLLFIWGIYYVYSVTQAAEQQRHLQACLSQVDGRDGSWKIRSHKAFCRNLYSDVQPALKGRYGPRSDDTISLVMVRRPDFRTYHYK